MELYHALISLIFPGKKACFYTFFFISYSIFSAAIALIFRARTSPLWGRWNQCIHDTRITGLGGGVRNKILIISWDRVWTFSDFPESFVIDSSRSSYIPLHNSTYLGWQAEII